MARSGRSQPNRPIVVRSQPQPVAVVGVFTTLTLSAPAGTLDIGAFRQPVPIVSAPRPNRTPHRFAASGRKIVLRNPAVPTSGTTIVGVAAVLTLSSTAGVIGLGELGGTPSIALSAPAGLVGIAKLGATPTLTLSAPNGTLSNARTIAGVFAKTVLLAPPGTFTGVGSPTTVFGATAVLALSALAGHSVNSRVTITNTISDATGVAVPGVKVTVHVQPPGAFSTLFGTELVGETVTDLAGTWTMLLEQNATILPSNSYYLVDEEIPDALSGPRQWAIRVDNTPGNVFQHLINPPPPGPPLPSTGPPVVVNGATAILVLSPRSAGIINGTPGNTIVSATRALLVLAPQTGSIGNVLLGPAVPVNVVASVIGGVLTITWQPGPGGGPVLVYSIISAPPLFHGASATTSLSTSNLAQFVPGQSYTFSVGASNAAGGTGFSLPSNAIVVNGPVVPTAPMNVFAVGGTLAATVSWQVPAFNGGSPILSYTVIPVRQT